jgi:multidrug efflux pump subunit AcrB
MYSLPLSLIGVVIGLMIFKMPISLTAVMGIVSLIGVVIRNAILLVEYINEGRHEGLSIDDACLNAVSQRFRPIILSSTATITGLVPLAFSKSTLFGPMSVTIIFGLAAATFLTFIVVPVMYSLVNTKLEERPIKVDKLSIKALIFRKNNLMKKLKSLIIKEKNYRK